MITDAPWLRAHLSGNLACLETGHLLVTTWPGDRLHVVQADPLILVTDEVLHELAAGSRCHPDVSLITPEPDRYPGVDWTGAVLTIRAENQTVVYRILDRCAWDREHPGMPSLFAMDCWPAQWPD